MCYFGERQNFQVQIDFLKNERISLLKRVEGLSRRSSDYKACMEKIRLYGDIEQSMYAFQILSRLKTNNHGL